MNDKKKMKFRVFIKKYWRLILGGGIIAAVIFCSIFAPILTDYDPEFVNMDVAKARPGEVVELPDGETEVHPLGTDALGRDVWARILYGSRSTLVVSIGAEVLGTIMGAVLGLICGYYTKAEKILMRFLDGFSTIPNLLLCMMMVSIFGAGIPNLILAMSIGGVPGTARMIRNQVLSLREKEFIESEKAMGAGDTRTVGLHILPHCTSYLIVRFSNGLAGSVLSMTSLSFLGLGLDPTTASWGGIINEAQTLLLVYPHILIAATVAISLTVFGFSILGDGVRDLLDPRLR